MRKILAGLWCILIAVAPIASVHASNDERDFSLCRYGVTLKWVRSFCPGVVSDEQLIEYEKMIELAKPDARVCRAGREDSERDIARMVALAQDIELVCQFYGHFIKSFKGSK